MGSEQRRILPLREKGKTEPTEPGEPKKRFFESTLPPSKAHQRIVIEVNVKRDGELTVDVHYYEIN
jgi:hypothetical protein